MDDGKIQADASKQGSGTIDTWNLCAFLWPKITQEALICTQRAILNNTPYKYRQIFADTFLGESVPIRSIYYTFANNNSNNYDCYYQ